VVISSDDKIGLGFDRAFQEFVVGWVLPDDVYRLGRMDPKGMLADLPQELLAFALGDADKAMDHTTVLLENSGREAEQKFPLWNPLDEPGRSPRGQQARHAYIGIEDNPRLVF